MDGSPVLGNKIGRPETQEERMSIKTIGIDLAKNVFELCGLDGDGEILLRRRVRRDTLLKAVGEIPACVIGIEACTGAFF